jgi:predicted aspartyl protease
VSHIYLDPNTGELRGTRPRSYMGLVLLAGVAFAGLSCVAISLSPHAPTQIEAIGGRDAIPFRSVNGGLFVYANLGGVPHNMQLDTGAGSSTVTLPIARVLVARRQATVMPGFLPFGMADGSVSEHQTIVVRTMRIGRHVLHDVRMVVTDDGANLLLGLPELSAIGNFTVDQSRSQIRFD